MGVLPSIWGHIFVRLVTESALRRGVGAKYSIYGLLILAGIGPPGQVEFDIGVESFLVMQYCLRTQVYPGIGPGALKA